LKQSRTVNILAKNPIAISIAFGQKAVKFDSKNVAFESGLEI